MDRPEIICHMFESVDGKTEAALFKSGRASSARDHYGKIRESYQADASLYGTKTMAQSYASGYREKGEEEKASGSFEDFRAESDSDGFLVAFDPEGVILYGSGIIERSGRGRMQVIEILTENVSDAFLEELRRKGVSYLFAGKEKPDLPLAVKKLKEQFGIQKIVLGGGGVTNWSFLEEGLLDEISLVIAPTVDGQSGEVASFQTSPFSDRNGPADLSLISAEVLSGDTLWIRYRPGKIR